MDKQPSLHPREEGYPAIYCCGWAFPWSALFWGGALVLVGGSWLLQNLGLISPGWTSFLFPLLLVVYGLILLLGIALRRR